VRQGRLRCLRLRDLSEEEAWRSCSFLSLTPDANATTRTHMHTYRVLDLKPDDIHARCPIILGSPTDVQRVLDIYDKHTQETAAAAKKEKVMVHA
jgi:hypothetical protein